MRRLLLIVVCVLSCISCNQSADVLKDRIEYNIEVNRKDMVGISDIIKTHMVKENERKDLKEWFYNAKFLRDDEIDRPFGEYDVNYLNKPSFISIIIFYHYRDDKKLVVCIKGHKDFMLFLTNKMKNTYSVRFLTDEQVDKYIYIKKDNTGKVKRH